MRGQTFPLSLKIGHITVDKSLPQYQNAKNLKQCKENHQDVFSDIENIRYLFHTAIYPNLKQCNHKRAETNNGKPN